MESICPSELKKTPSELKITPSHLKLIIFCATPKMIPAPSQLCTSCVEGGVKDSGVEKESKRESKGLPSEGAVGHSLWPQDLKVPESI